MQMVTLPHATSRQRIAQAFDRGATGCAELAKILAAVLVALVLVFRPQGLFGAKAA